MPTKMKTSAKRAGAQKVLFADLHEDRELCLRRSPISPLHVTALVKAIRSGCRLPPLLVWREQDDAQNATGRLVLIDGWHRLKALRRINKNLTAVEATIIAGTKAEALLAAVAENSRDMLPLCQAERMDAAWKIVRADSGTASKRNIAIACSVSPRTVAAMRKKWRTWPVEDGEDGHSEPVEVTGRWARDQHAGTQEVPWEPMNDRERDKLVETFGEELRDVLKKLPKYHDDVLGDALKYALGDRRLREIMDYLVGSDDDWPTTGLEAEDEYDDAF
jgi:hypothetical protein